MSDLGTRRLLLHAVDVDEAQEIRDGSRTGQLWAVDFPFEGDLGALGGFLRASAALGEQRPFGYYLIRRRTDGLAIGGVGFKGPPSTAALEIGYGLAASARGLGYAAEAVAALLGLATLGVARVDAETDPDNIASIKTLQRNGFQQLDPAPDGTLRWSRPVSSRLD